MGQVIRVSLPGYNALTDTDPDHFALYSDEDWVLIKEYTRGSISADSGGEPVSYTLDYISTILIYYQDGGIWKSLTGHYFDIDTGGLLPHVIIDPVPGTFWLYGSSGTPTNFKYFICYDNQL